MIVAKGWVPMPPPTVWGSEETLGLYFCVYSLGSDQPKYVAPEIRNQNSGPPGQNFDSECPRFCLGGLQSRAGLAHRGFAIECRALQSRVGLWNQMLGSASLKKIMFFEKKLMRIGPSFVNRRGRRNGTVPWGERGRPWDPPCGGGEGSALGPYPLGRRGGGAALRHV